MMENLNSQGNVTKIPQLGENFVGEKIGTMCNSQYFTLVSGLINQETHFKKHIIRVPVAALQRQGVMGNVRPTWYVRCFNKTVTTKILFSRCKM